MPLRPEGFARGAGIDLGGSALLERLEVERQPSLARLPELCPAGEAFDRFAGPDPADQVLLVPAGEDQQFGRVVVQAGLHHGGVPLPAVLADEGRIGLHRVAVEIVQYERVHPVSGEGPLPAHGEEFSLAADHLRPFARADETRTLLRRKAGRTLDESVREKGTVGGREDRPLHPAVETHGQRRGIGGDRDPAVGIEAQQVGRKQFARAQRLAVLRRHGDDEPPHAPPGESLQHAVVGFVEGRQLQHGEKGPGEPDELRAGGGPCRSLFGHGLHCCGMPRSTGFSRTFRTAAPKIGRQRGFPFP